LGFGHVVGQALDEPVLLLKSCIGNRGLGWDLLPPGSERVEFLQKDRSGVEKTMVFAGYKDRPNSWEMDKAKGLATEPPPWVDKNGKPVEWYAGKQYDDDVANAKAVLADLGKYYPGATKHEVAGFVWWQGHKDQGEPYASRYEQNLVRFIKALRKDFGAPDAKFAIATGCGNPGTEGGGLKVAEAQLAVSGEKGKYPEFKGNVKSTDTRVFWPSADDSPTKAGYHYCHNAGTYMNTGLALGQAMVELLQNR
jgi:alpha-galactosidase